MSTYVPFRCPERLEVMVSEWGRRRGLTRTGAIIALLRLGLGEIEDKPLAPPAEHKHIWMPVRSVGRSRCACGVWRP